MNRIIRRRVLAPAVVRIDLEAPRIARIRKPGQFVIVRKGPGSERVPLTIADADPEAATIALVIQAVGKSTLELASLAPGDAIASVSGPLGRATELLDGGRAVCIGGGVGTAVVFPIARGLRAKGIEVTSIIGGRTKDLVIFEDELRECGEVIPCTDDGSHGRKGFVTEALADRIWAGGIDAVYAVGPVPMMRAVSELTRPAAIRTIVSLNPIMIDGTGMCGGCRVTVGGKMRFACVDGPEFDGHAVDYAELLDRLGAYRPQEAVALRRYREERTEACRLDGAAR